jgi:hypothetical protein
VSRLPHLPDAARRGLELGRPHRLHRIDNHQGRFEARNFLEDPLDARFGQEIQRRLSHAEPVAAALHLVLGLFA